MMEEKSFYQKQLRIVLRNRGLIDPVLSTLKYFEKEYIAHIKDGRCPAGAIPGERRKVRVIDYEKCIKRGQCSAHCPVGAIYEKVDTGRAKSRKNPLP